MSSKICPSKRVWGFQRLLKHPRCYISIFWHLRQCVFFGNFFFLEYEIWVFNFEKAFPKLLNLSRWVLTLVRIPCLVAKRNFLAIPDYQKFMFSRKRSWKYPPFPNPTCGVKSCWAKYFKYQVDISFGRVFNSDHQLSWALRQNKLWWKKIIHGKNDLSY